MADVEERIARLEEWRGRIQTDLAVQKADREYMQRSFDDMRGRLDRIDGHIAKLVWIVISSLVLGVLAWIYKGGLAGGIGP